jgi:quercetin dioxygenase-like cupin family protein
MQTKDTGGKTMRSIIRLGSFGLVFATLVLAARSARAQDLEQVKVKFQHAIPNVQGKSMVAVIVSYPPGGKSAAHHHAPSAFIYAYVLSGSIRSKVGDEPAKVYKVGESFYEVPGSHHIVSENASAQEPASLLAIFVVDSKHSALTIPDKR